MTIRQRMTGFVLALALVAATSPLLAATAKDELTFSADLFNPNQGDTVWSATGEYLIGLGTGAFRLGPSVSMFDLGPVDGSSFGVAAEFGFPKSGLFVGGAAHKLSGNAADVADYSGEARFGVKFGGEAGFVKLYASEVWAKQADGAVTDPDGTSVQVGLGLRF